jgi:hypothetical protein
MKYTYYQEQRNIRNRTSHQSIAVEQNKDGSSTPERATILIVLRIPGCTLPPICAVFSSGSRSRSTSEYTEKEVQS